VCVFAVQVTPLTLGRCVCVPRTALCVLHDEVLVAGPVLSRHASWVSRVARGLTRLRYRWWKLGVCF